MHPTQLPRLQVPDEEWNDQDFRLGKLGKALNVVAIPGTKLAFYGAILIAFSGSTWIVRINQWGSEVGEAMDTLEESPQHHTNERLPTINFFLALREHIENPQVLLDVVARQAIESMRDL